MEKTLKRKFADINTSLQKCDAIAKSIMQNDEEVDAEEKDIVKDISLLEADCNAATLKLNKLYLNYTVAMSKSFAKERHASAITRETSRRREAVQRMLESDMTVSEAIALIKDEIFGEAINEDTPPSNGSHPDNVVSDYGKFVESICANKDLVTPSHSSSALRKLIDGYLTREFDQNNDDFFTSDDVVVKPECPITREIIERAERAPCGHFFSSEGLDTMFSGGDGPVKCSASGCSTRFYRKDCYHDRFVELEGRIWKAKANNQQEDNSTLARI